MSARRSPTRTRPMFERIRKLFGAPLPNSSIVLHSHHSSSSFHSSSSKSDHHSVHLHPHSHQHQHQQHLASKTISSNRHSHASSRTAVPLLVNSSNGHRQTDSVRRQPLSTRQQRLQSLRQQIADQQSQSEHSKSIEATKQQSNKKKSSVSCQQSKEQQHERVIVDNKTKDLVDGVQRDTCNNLIYNKENQPESQQKSMSSRNNWSKIGPQPISTSNNHSIHHQSSLAPSYKTSSASAQKKPPSNQATKCNYANVSSNKSPSSNKLTSSANDSSLNSNQLKSVGPRNVLPRRSSSFKHRQHSPPPAMSFIQHLLDSSTTRPKQPEVLFGSTCDQLPERLLNNFNENVVAAFTGPGDGLTEQLQDHKHQPQTNEMKVCAKMLDNLHVDFIDDEEDEMSSSNDSTPSVTPTRQLVRQRDQIRRGQSKSTSGPISNVYSFANANLRANESDISTQNSSNWKAKQDLNLIAGLSDWKYKKSFAYGASVSLYEQHPNDGRKAGEPLADCFGIVARGNNACLALADGVNWGSGSRLAATSAVNGAIDYLNAILISSNVQTTTQLFEHLLRAFSAAHEQILKRNGHLTTLTVAVIAQLKNSPDFVACTCNVGDSLAYVYNSRFGVREITQGSHDIYSMRDMRDALGALGPVNGHNPELGNLTVAMTIVERSDIVFITSDGVSDNFDPVVGKFALAQRPQSEPPVKCLIKPLLVESNQTNNQRKERNLFQQLLNFSRSTKSTNESTSGSSSSSTSRLNRSSGLRRSNSNPGQRSNREVSQSRGEQVMVVQPPFVSAEQRHVLGLLQMEQILKHGLCQNNSDETNKSNANDSVQTAEQLVERLLQYVHRLTAAKRSVLQDPALYDFSDPNHFTASEQKLRRRKVAPMLAPLPGKLDHATVVAYQVDFYGAQCESMKSLKRSNNHHQTLKATLVKNSLEDL